VVNAADWPACPACGTPAALVISAQQAFCGNDDCRIFMWEPGKTMDELLENLTTIDLRRPPESS
jgi:hypothetical protein